MTVVEKSTMIPIKELLDDSFRTKNKLECFDYYYTNKATKPIKGYFIDQYQELETKHQHEYVILYDSNKQCYRRIRRTRIEQNIEEYSKPEFLKEIYYLQLYKSYGIFINFIDEFNEDKYIVYVPGENKYRIIKKDVLKVDYARKM